MAWLDARNPVPPPAPNKPDMGTEDYNPVLGRQRQQDQKFKAILGCSERQRKRLEYIKPFLEKSKSKWVVSKEFKC